MTSRPSSNGKLTGPTTGTAFLSSSGRRRRDAPFRRRVSRVPRSSPVEERGSATPGTARTAIYYTTSLSLRRVSCPRPPRFSTGNPRPRFAFVLLSVRATLRVHTRRRRPSRRTRIPYRANDSTCINRTSSFSGYIDWFRNIYIYIRMFNRPCTPVQQRSSRKMFRPKIYYGNISRMHVYNTHYTHTIIY